MKITHRHPGPKVRYHTSRNNIKFRKRPMHVQTLIFPKNRFTRKKAIDWAKEHGFKGLTSREEGNSIRVRQFSPEDVERYGGTFPIGKDVKGVYAEVKLEKYENKDYKYLKDKFNISKTGDDDKDKVINKDDCRPWDKKRQDEDETENIFSSTQFFTFRKGEGIPFDVEDGDIVKIELNEGYVEGTVVGTGKYETHKLVRVDKGTPIEK